MIKIETPIIEEKKAEQEISKNAPTPSADELKAAVEKIGFLEAEQKKDKEMLTLMLNPENTEEELKKHGATIDTWEGTAKINNILFKRGYLKSTYRFCSLV